MPEGQTPERSAFGLAPGSSPIASGVFRGPFRRRVWGGCLWLDVTGFTPLTEQLSERGPAGIEALSVTLDRLYARVGSRVAETGGEVLFFAGDGAMCLWAVGAEEHLSSAVLAAASTAVRLRRELEAEAREERLEVRQVVVSGDITVDTLGGEAGVWLEVVSGEPLTGLSRLSKLCGPNQVLLGAPSAQRIGRSAEVRALTSEAVLLLNLSRHDRGRMQSEPSLLMPASVPSPARQTPGVANSELRRVSVVFVHWSHDVAPGWHDLQNLTAALQQATLALSGFLCQLVRDEKGFTGMVVFGLPGQAQGEDSLRAVRLVTSFSRRAAELGVRVKAGVATGPAFCGVCGNGAERQYCVLGNTVNRAARLTELADDGPLVDEPTFAQTQRRLTFTHQGRIRVRGLKHELDVYRPGVFGQTLAGPRRLIGFEREAAELWRALAGLVSDRGSPLVIKGELGAGKSALLSRLPAWCAELSLLLCAGAADELDQYTGYFALRGVVRELFGDLRQAEGQATLLDLIAKTAHSLELAPLLNPLFLTEFASTALVSQMSPETRAENRERLVEDLFRVQLADRKLVIAIDDAHWIDASSLALLEFLAKRLPSLLCIFATRPGETNLSRRLADARSIEISALDSEALARLVLEHVDALAVAPTLTDLVASGTRGNPLHCIELVRGLTASGRVAAQGGVLQLQGADDGQLQIPGTLEELILARFDGLSALSRQALRAASVMGVSFDLRVIRVVLGSQMSLAELDLALGESVQRQMIRAHDAFEFEHASIQSVIYSLLLPSEQRALHEQTALALQGLHASNLKPVAARLAHHWLCAGNAGNAAEYSALAADLALQGYANVDAAHLFSQAIEQDHAWRGPQATDLRRARWSLSMAQALYSQSRHADARAAYERALAWTGVAKPRGIAQLPFTIFGATSTTYARRLFGRAPAILRGEQREQRLAAIRVIHAWATLDIWEGRLPEAANKAISAYRLAESVVDSPEAAEIISGLGYMLATTPARRHADGHLARALGIAESTGDLQARTSTRVLLGMYLVLSGQTPRAEEPLRIAVALADRLGSGLWRHRAHFALGEWLLFAGELEAAHGAFQEAANIAAAAEPPVEGFANCMAALAVMRRGALGQAQAIVSGERGLGLLEAECLVLQRFTSLGIGAEVAFRAGNVAHALSLAERALELSRSRGDVDVFFAALHGHAGLVFVFSNSLERLRASGGRLLEGRDRRALLGKLNEAMARLKTFARKYPGARACAERLRGDGYALKGHARAARSAWARAELFAQGSRQPYEQMLALRALAAADPARAELAQSLANHCGVIGETATPRSPPEESP